MFGKVAADLLGLSDIGAVIKPQDYDKVDSDDYVMHEDNERIFFLIKSRTDEYCFTNEALIHLDGTSAINKKRLLNRYPYHKHAIDNVYLETAGTIDLDVEIKFTLGAKTFSIPVNKKHIEELKDLYKSLIKIAEITHENQLHLGYSKQSLDTAVSTLGQIAKVVDISLSEQFDAIKQSTFTWLSDAHKQYVVKDFAFVFERYINH